MGLTQNLGRLSPSIFSDASLNIGVGAAPSGSYKFEVTGTSKVSGVLTLGSTLSNGTYTYTLPSATGTIALTSDIPTNPVGGTGTTNTLPKFTAASTIGNSNITDTGSLITLGSNSYVNGSLGIGTTSLTAFNLRVLKNITGATSAYGISSEGTIQSDVTYQTRGFSTFLGTQAATFSSSFVFHYLANQGTFGVGSTVDTQIGFQVESSLIGATTNIGFQSQIPSGTNRWNLYMSGTANNYMAGSLGIGTNSLTGYSLRVSKTITGATTSYVIRQDGVVQSDVTSDVIGLRNDSNTAAAAFTLTNYTHFWARQGTIGAGSAITNQYGYRVDSNMTGATNNFGFLSEIPSGTNRWNLYMNGTAANYMAGSLGIGATNLTGVNLFVSKTLTGSVDSYHVNVNGIIQSDVTNSATYFRSSVSTAAAAFTLGTINHYVANQGTLGAGSTVTNQYGFIVNSNLIGATNNFGFYGNIPSGTNRWNLYMAGTAANYMAGSLGIGATSINASAKVQIDSTTQGFLPPRMTSAQRTAIASPATGLIVYQTDSVEGLYVYSGGSWKSLTMV